MTGPTEHSIALPPIVCGIDDRYAQALCVLMESLVAAHRGNTVGLRLIVLHRQLSGSSRRALRLHAERLELSLELRRVSAADRRFPVSGWVSDAVYLRLAMPEVVDEPTVLYLDADVLILGDLRPLLRRSIQGVPVAAVRDPQNPVIGRGIALPGWRDLGLPAGREYFNSGVMLLDLTECRSSKVFERSRWLLSEHPGSVRFWDQDALNWAVADAWLPLERSWNTFAMSVLASREDFVHYAEPVMPLAELVADEDTAAVIHFAGPDKPWADGYPASRLRDRYRRFLDNVRRHAIDDAAVR